MISVGFSFSASLFGGWTISFGLAISNSDEYGIEFGGYAGTGPGAAPLSGSGGIQLQYSGDAESIDILGGPSVSIGGGYTAPSPLVVLGPSVGADFVKSLDPKGGLSSQPSIKSVTIGVSRPGPDVHVYHMQTRVKKWVSLNDEALDSEADDNENHAKCSCSRCEACSCSKQEKWLCPACKAQRR